VTSVFLKIVRCAEVAREADTPAGAPRGDATRAEAPVKNDDRQGLAAKSQFWQKTRSRATQE
jgi:hypothetical protein